MVDRFLGWKLPEHFHPDAGISFKAAFNEHTAYPMKHEPSGTNLFDAEQATEMVRYMVEGIDARPAASEPPPANTRGEREKVIEECAQRAEDLMISRTKVGRDGSIQEQYRSATGKEIAKYIRALAEDGPPTKEGFGTHTPDDRTGGAEQGSKT